MIEEKREKRGEQSEEQVIMKTGMVTAEALAEKENTKA